MINLPTWYDTGTVSVASGGTTVTLVGGYWGDDAIMAGDLFCDPAQPMVPPQRVKEVTGDTTLELWAPWPGSAMAADPYEIRYVGIIERSTAQSRRVLEQLGDVKSWADIFVQTDADRLALESPTNPLAAKLRVLVVDDGAIWQKMTSTFGDWIGPADFRGDTGNKGWSPVHSAVVDGSRRVWRLVDWVGGEGSKPVGIGKYVGPNGLVDTAAAATDIRGPAGDISGVTSFWQNRITVDADANSARGGLGAAAKDNPEFSGSLRHVVGAGAGPNRDITVTSKATPLTSDRALLHIENADKQFSLRVSSYWTAAVNAPFNNNDSVLSEIFNDVPVNTANQTWAFSGANAYNKIPAGVVDSGMRVGVLGWSVSVNSKGYIHAGRLGEQHGVWGRAGFQGGGEFQSPNTARVTKAVAVRGEIATDSPGARIDTAMAGLFESVCNNAQIDENYAIYARASGATTTNYSFYGEAGKLLNKEAAVIAAGAVPFPGSSNLTPGAIVDPVGNLFLARAGTDAKASLQSLPGGSSSAILAAFLWNASVTGTITHTSTTTTYATSSDHRLEWKEGRIQLEGSGDFIDALKPYWFPRAGKAGFVAHEFAEVSPVSVTGEKDAVHGDGSPIYQQMQASTDDVIANMVAELQSLRKRVAELEAQV